LTPERADRLGVDEDLRGLLRIQRGPNQIYVVIGTGG